VSAQDVQERYKVPAVLNMRIKVRGTLGTIAGFEGPRLLVMIDGQKALTTVHPVLGVEYPPPGKAFPAFSKPVRRHLSLVPGEPAPRRGPGRPPKVRSDMELGLVPLPVDDPLHGTVDGYRKYKCKCEPCRVAWRLRCREFKAARIAQTLDPDDRRHGTVNFYSNYGCRCRPCTDAMVSSDPRINKRKRGTRPYSQRPRSGKAQEELQSAHREVAAEVTRQDIAS
jgi:hypothetical protein